MLETLWIIENYRKQILIRLEPLCEILTSTLQTWLHAAFNKNLIFFASSAQHWTWQTDKCFSNEKRDCSEDECSQHFRRLTYRQNKSSNYCKIKSQTLRPGGEKLLLKLAKSCFVCWHLLIYLNQDHYNVPNSSYCNHHQTDQSQPS